MHLLAPLSWPYAAVMDIRNWMFDHGWLHERAFTIPTVCIGNLTVGGTGKTPHTEWLVQHLIDNGQCVGILSRGYGRTTRGYIEASPTSTAATIGDEPLQMFLHFQGRAVVAVCEDRCKGIEQLTQRHPSLDVIVMDDAYQHRYVRPTLRILLTDYSRPYYRDQVLPVGRLRERPRGAQRADIIIVTKCPATLSETEQSTILEDLAPQPQQHVFFTTMDYAPLPIPSQPIAVLAGIARPQPLIDYLRSAGYHIADTLLYPDHHNFSHKNLAEIEHVATQSVHIVTTAKDHARLIGSSLSDAARRKIIVQNILVNVLNNDENHLFNTIKAYVSRH